MPYNKDEYVVLQLKKPIGDLLDQCIKQKHKIEGARLSRPALVEMLATRYLQQLSEEG